MTKEGNAVRLRKGNIFHKKIQKSWGKEAQGKVKPERPCVKPSGKKGRMDIHVEFEDEDKLVSCVEIKNTDWNRMTEQSIRRNVKRQIMPGKRRLKSGENRCKAGDGVG